MVMQSPKLVFPPRKITQIEVFKKMEREDPIGALLLGMRLSGNDWSGTPECQCIECQTRLRGERRAVAMESESRQNMNKRATIIFRQRKIQEGWRDETDQLVLPL